MARPHIAHNAMQIAKIIDSEHDMRRPERKIPGQEPLVNFANWVAHRVLSGLTDLRGTFEPSIAEACRESRWHLVTV